MTTSRDPPHWPRGARRPRSNDPRDVCCWIFRLFPGSSNKSPPCHDIHVPTNLLPHSDIGARYGRITKLGFIQQTLWNNAGFACLRDRPELEAFEPRYEPLVIKTGGATTTTTTSSSSSSSASASASAPNEGDYLLSLQREDWESRRPVAKTHWSVLDYHHAYVAGELTPTAVAKALLPLINRDVQKPHQHSTAYLQVREDLVLKAAGESTKRYAEGRFLSVLDGVPVAVKDEMDLRYVRGERESRSVEQSRVLIRETVAIPSALAPRLTTPVQTMLRAIVFRNGWTRVP